MLFKFLKISYVLLKGKHLYSKRRINLLILLLENVKCILESLFKFFINTFYYKINTYILLSCNLRFGIKKKKQQKTKQLQSSQLVLWIPSARLSTRFDDELAINLALLTNFIL